MVAAPMPKIVDHDARRATLCLAAAQVIHAQGLEAATVRAIARAAGCSTGVLAHYFADKDDLVAHVLAFVNRRPIERMLARLQASGIGAPPPSAEDSVANDASASTTAMVARSIAPLVDEALPLDEERRMEWSVRLAIWGFRPHLQSFAPPGESSWLETAEGLVVLGQARGVVPPHLDAKIVVGRLVAAIMGASLCTVLDPIRFDATWLRMHVTAILDDVFRASVETT